MPLLEGHLEGQGGRFAIVVSRFNSSICEALLSSAIDGFSECGVQEKDLVIHWVPGAYEIPLIASKVAESKKFDAVLTLGCVIRGETVHFDLIVESVSLMLQKIALKNGIPIIFSILATENMLQAEERTHAGRTGALTAVEMASLVKRMEH